MNFDWKDKTIIIAEDNKLNFLLLEKMLEKTSVKIIWTKNGQEIVDYIEKNNEVDLILMDLNMPQMNGLETTIYMREKNFKTPIIIQSAISDYSEIDKFMEAGCNDFIDKPISKKVLLDKIALFFDK